MKFSLLNIKYILVLILALPNLAFSADTTSMDVHVQADIHASMHMQWDKLDADDERYQEMKAKMKIGNDWSLLPYGLYTELRTNDPNRMVSLRISDFFSKNQNNVIKNEYVYVSVNGKGLHPASKDVALLYPEDRAQLKKYVLLFLIKMMPNHRSGRYSANFQFITNTLP